ncbi:MAG TPA: hypothetical protein VGP72_27095 [Planctomycetota bacterium]|jgi:hypothetical protein
MSQRILLVVLFASLVAVASARAASTHEPPGNDKRVTLVGMGKALVDPNGKFDAKVVYATLTVTEGNGKETVYDVMGGAGLFLAKEGDGKKCEVSGVVYEKNGRKRIVGRSIDMKVIVVDDDSEKKKSKN